MATAPNESKFNANTRSPRFSTQHALGFTGGKVDPVTGNLQEPSFTQQAGINPPPTPDPGISAFNSSMIPRPAGLGTTLATSALGAVAGEGAKQGIKALGSSLTGAGADTAAGTVAGATGALTAPESVAAGVSDIGVGAGTIGTGAGAAGALTAPEAVAAGVSDIGIGSAGGALAGTEAAGAAGAGAAAGGGGLLAGIGDFLGSIGGAIAALFFAVVEETLQHVGIDPNGPEHQIIQQFAIARAQGTPEGQQFMQEYVALCPQLIAIINSMPGGERIWFQNYQQFVGQAVTALQTGDEQRAGELLTDMIWFLVSAAEETTAGKGITLELNSLASLADKALIEGRSDAPQPGEPTGPSGVPFSSMSGGPGGADQDEDMDTDAMMMGGGMRPMGGMPASQPQMPSGYGAGAPQPDQHMSQPMPGQGGTFPTPPKPAQGAPMQPPGAMPEEPDPQGQGTPPIAQMFARRY